MGDAAQHDLFLSYRRADAPRLEPLLAALQAQGLRVWRDTREIEDFSSVQQSIDAGLGRSRAMLVWYSVAYNESRACQWELTAGYLAAQADPETGRDPRRRVLVINPEPGNSHIHLPELFDQQWLASPAEGDDAATRALAQRIQTVLAQVPATPLGNLRALIPPRWCPYPGTGSTRFVGRLREMWQLHGHLQTGEAAMLTGSGGLPGLAQVRGAGGIGKSLLAEEYALRFGGAYPGGIFWLRAGGFTDRDDEISPTERLSRLEGQIIGFAQQLGLHISGLSPREVQGLFAGHLGRQGQPFLWIVDDLPADPGPEGLAPWLAPHPLGRTLITTRARRFNHVRQIELPQLDEPEALRLLSRNRPLGDADRPIAETICRELGCHALAVDVAAALIEQCGFVSFLTRLQQASADKDALEVAARLDEALPNGHQRSIAATLLASIRELDAPTLDVLRLASLLAPTPIPRDLIWRSIARADRLEPDDAQDLCDLALSRAKSSSLADPADAGGIVVHTLVSRTLRLHRPDDERSERLRSAAVAVLNLEMPRAADIREHTSLMKLVPHASFLGQELNELGTIILLEWVARYSLEQGQYLSAEMDYARVLKASALVLGSKHRNTRIFFTNFAVLLRKVGDLLGSRELLEKILFIQRREDGEEHLGTLMVQEGLAATMFDQGDLIGAHKLQESVLGIRRRVLGEEASATLRSISNLALTLQEEGDLIGSRQLQEYVLSVQRRVLGEESSDTLTSMNNLAMNLQMKGDLSGARKLQESVLGTGCRVWGKEHSDTLIAINNLALTIWKQGNLPEARHLLEVCLDIQRRVLDQEHPNILSATGNLATLVLEQGDVSRSRSLLESVLCIQRRVLGEEHPATLRTIHNFAALLKMEGDLPGARHLQESVLGIQQRLIGEEHPDTLRSICNLAVILQEQSDFAGARQLLEYVVGVRHRVLGYKHTDTTLSAWNLFCCLRKLLKFEEAELLHSELLVWLQTSPLGVLSGRQLAIAQLLRKNSTS